MEKAHQVLFDVFISMFLPAKLYLHISLTSLALRALCYSIISLFPTYYRMEAIKKINTSIILLYIYKDFLLLPFCNMQGKGI